VKKKREYIITPYKLQFEIFPNSFTLAFNIVGNVISYIIHKD